MGSFTSADIGKQVEVDPAPMAGTYDELPSQVVRRADGKAEGKILRVARGTVCKVHQPILLVDFRTESWWVPQSACALLGAAPVATQWLTVAEKEPPVGTRVTCCIFSTWNMRVDPNAAEKAEIIRRWKTIPFAIAAGGKLNPLTGVYRGAYQGRDSLVTYQGYETFRCDSYNGLLRAFSIWMPEGVKAVSSWPHKCPACGSPALQLFASMECSSPGCKYHKDYVK